MCKLSLTNSRAALSRIALSLIALSFSATVAAAQPAVLRTNVDGISDTGLHPADVDVAANANHVIQVANGAIQVYDKNGTPSGPAETFLSFFINQLPQNWAGIGYEPSAHTYNDRLIISIMGVDPFEETSHLFLAISKTADLADGWWKYAILLNNEVQDDTWVGDSSLSFDNSGIYLAGNLYDFEGDFEHARIHIFSSSLFDGIFVRLWRSEGALNWPSTVTLAKSLRAARVGGGRCLNSAMYFVNSHALAGNELLVWTLTGSRLNPTLTSERITVDSYTYIDMEVDQPNAATHIDGGDARVRDAVYCGNSIVATLVTDPLNNNSSSGIYTAAVDADAGTLVWDHTMMIAPTDYLFAPGLQAGFRSDGNSGMEPNWIRIFHNHVNSFLAYAAVNTTYYPDPLGSATFHRDMLKTGEGAYVHMNNLNRNVWSKRAGVAVYNDEVWAAVQYAGPANNWESRLLEYRAADVFVDGFESGDTSSWSAAIGLQ